MKNWSEARGSERGSHRLHEVRTNNKTLQEDIFAILENGSVETMLRGAIDVECKPSSKHLAGEIKNKDDLLTIGPFVETMVAGPAGPPRKWGGPPGRCPGVLGQSYGHPSASPERAPRCLTN